MKTGGKYKSFNNKKYYLRKEGLSKSEAKFWKDNYLNQGYKVRVVKGTSFTDKYKYYVYVR